MWKVCPCYDIIMTVGRSSDWHLSPTVIPGKSDKSAFDPRAAYRCDAHRLRSGTQLDYALLALCAGNPLVNGGLLAQRASKVEIGSMWWYLNDSRVEQWLTPISCSHPREGWSISYWSRIQPTTGHRLLSGTQIDNGEKFIVKRTDLFQNFGLKLLTGEFHGTPMLISQHAFR